jgi:16S rRNA (cytosine1402-N4)-methyltransferase
MKAGMPAPVHLPVLLEETVRALAVQPGGRYLDCTLGDGGHAAAILERSSPGGELLGIDADPQAIAVAGTRLQEYGRATLLVNENFADLEAICMRYDFRPVYGILFDLGLSSQQLGDESRGFSFQHNGLLDMRFSPDQEVTAADIINRSPEAELADMIRSYGEEAHSRQIARRIVQERPVATTLELAKIIEQAVGGRKGKLHPATKTFQALRIAVNQELKHLESALGQAVKLLGFGGRLVVISYHSLEDRIVKQFMNRESKDCICPPGIPTCVCGHSASLRLVNRRVITPSSEEVASNPRSRSAKLRAAERLVFPDSGSETAERLCFSIAERANGWRRPVLLQRLRTAFGAS